QHVLANMFTLMDDVCRNQNMFDSELSTDSRNIASSKVSHHAPIIGIGNSIHFKDAFYVMQCIQAIAPTADAYYTLGSSIASAKGFDELVQRRLALVSDLAVCPAIIADALIIEVDKRHRLRKNASNAPAKFALPCRTVRIFARDSLDPLNSFI